MTPPILYPADLVLVCGGGWLADTIRQCEQGPGEAPSRASHVAGVVDEAPLEIARVVEALASIQENPLASYRGTPVRIIRRSGLTWAKRLAIVAAARKHMGDRYPYGQIAAHAADYALAKIGQFATLGFWKPSPPVVFRHLAAIDPTNICSTLWARAYAEHGLDFGWPAHATEPDDMDDYTTPINGWETVWDWGVVP